MKNHIFHILDHWYPQRANKRWALALVTDTRGSVYRKAGAIVLISDQNDVLGMLSGGCLESDLQLQAQRVIETGRSHAISYDATDEDGLAWQLGIGCGGVANIVIHPCHRGNDYLALSQAYQNLKQRHNCRLQICLREPSASAHVADRPFVTVAGPDSIDICLSPPPHLLIFGAGIDVIPIVNLADDLGWHITLVDKRPSHFKPQRFPPHTELIHSAAGQLRNAYSMTVDAVIIASHSLSQDAEALAWVQNSRARYCGLLGPSARREQVLHRCGMREQDLRLPLAGPMGLGLGGELPESIALAVLCECHAVLFGGTAKPLSRAYF